MELELRRIARKETYTIGKLSIDGEDFCDTIEDRDRGLSQEMPEHKIKEIKVYGQTAIPTGRYKVDMNTVSLRFKERSWAKPYDGKLPRLIGVPGFEGVLIHPLNTAQESNHLRVKSITHHSDMQMYDFAAKELDDHSILVGNEDGICISIFV